jgi:hypothetical protein
VVAKQSRRRPFESLRVDLSSVEGRRTHQRQFAPGELQSSVMSRRLD